MPGLYEHQKQAVRDLRPGSILCGGVGTGKSRTAIAFYLLRICGATYSEDHNLIKDTAKRHIPLYIITTARKRDTFEWAAECATFGLSSEIRDSKDRDVVIDSWNNIKKYVDVTDAFFIFDEQRVVGKGAWVKSFLKIAKHNKWILLTATPGDTWMDYVPVFIANGYFKNRTQFIRRHVVYAPMTKFPVISRYLHEDELNELRRRVLVEMDYKNKAEQNDIWRYTLYNKVLYDEVCSDRWDILKNEPIQNLGRYCYLQRYICNHDPDRLSELMMIRESFDKLIVFYNFDYELEILRAYCESEKIPHAEWNGHRHEDIPDTNEWIFLVQYSAGAEGWNCISTNCIVFYSLTYSYKTLHQARGRIDRMNTPFSSLYYFYLTTRSPIDRRIKSVLQSKKNFNEREFALDLGFSFSDKTHSIMEGEE